MVGLRACLIGRDVVSLRLRAGKRLHHARAHAEAGEPVSDAVAASVFLPLSEQTRMERRGRVPGESRTRRGRGALWSSPGCVVLPAGFVKWPPERRVAVVFSLVCRGCHPFKL